MFKEEREVLKKLFAFPRAKGDERISVIILSRFKHVSHPRVGIVCIFNKGERERKRGRKKNKEKEIRMNVESKKRTEPTSRRVRYVCVFERLCVTFVKKR